MNVVKLSCCSCALSSNTQQPTAVVESLSQGAWEAIFDSSAHKGSYRMEPAPASRLLPCALISLSCCAPARQEGLCVKSAAATAAPAASASCSPSNTCTHTHTSGLPQQRESVHQRLKTPTDARHYAKLPRPHVIIGRSQPHRRAVKAITQNCLHVMLSDWTRMHGHARTHATWVFLGYWAVWL